MNATSVLDLPIDVLGAICRYLSLHDMVSLLKVCRRLYRNIRRLPIWWPKRCGEGTPYDRFLSHFVIPPGTETLTPFSKAYLPAVSIPNAFAFTRYSVAIEIAPIREPPDEWNQVIMVTYRFSNRSVSVYLFGYHDDFLERVFMVEILHGRPAVMQMRIQNGLERLPRGSWMGIPALLESYWQDSRNYFPPPKIDELGEGHWLITR